jgi:Ca2+-binding RTX toxin-like protein
MSRGRWLATAATAVLGLTVATLGGTGAANAAAPAPGTVYLRGGGGSPFVLYFVAGGGGTVNKLSTHTAAGNRVELLDLAAPVTLDAVAARICTQVHGSEVSCQVLPGMSLNVALGDGADEFSNLDTSLVSAVRGEDGNDFLIGGQGADQLNGGPGDDSIYGSGGDDVLTGEAGRDEFYGNSGRDRIYGDAGDDTLNGNEDGDQLYGGGGVDTLHGDEGDDYLLGGGGKDGVYGNQGNDTLVGDSDNDELNGLDGDDTLIADVAGDYYGGNGTDTIAYGGWNAGVRVTLDDKQNDQRLPICTKPIGCPVVWKHNAHSDIEKVVGSPRDDQLVGSEAMNWLYGGEGNDRLEGRGGNDVLDAQGGTSQALLGGTGMDTCVGAGALSFDSCEQR